MDKYDLEYLQNLIANKIEESLHLDYKASGALAKQDKKISEISKDVSAMANSDGGIIIYGISEDEKNEHLPKEIQPIKRKEFPKEWLEQIIHGNIQPRLNGVNIFPISISDEEVVYIVHIPKSDTAHQASDKRYYKRFNFLATQMHDYEIRDIFNRAKNPQIELEFTYLHKSNVVNVIAFNRGTVYAKYLSVKIRLAKRLVVDWGRNKILDNDTVEISANNAIREMVNPHAAIATYWPPRHEPILPKTGFQLIKIALSGFPLDDEDSLEWEIFCDNASPVSGSIRLADLLNS